MRCITSALRRDINIPRIFIPKEGGTKVAKLIEILNFVNE